MKILYIITGLRHGGAEKLLYLTCKYLREKYAVEILVCYFDPYAPMQPLFDGIGVETRCIKRNLFTVFRLAKLIRERDIDVVHTHLIHADIYGRIAALLPFRKKDLKIVSTAHGTEWFRWRKSIYCAMVRRLDRWLSLPENSRIIAISASVRDMLIMNEGIAADKITLLYNAVEVPDALPPSREREIHAPLRILYVGRLAPEKNIPCLLRAMTRLRDIPITLTIVGEGKMADALADEIIERDLMHRVQLAGASLTPEAFYASHDLFVLPSMHEGLGIVILEAFCHGLPVIGSRVDGIVELLDEDRGLLFDSDDDAQLASHIWMLSRDAEMCQILRQRGFEYVSTTHDIRQYIKVLMQIYEDTVSS